MAWMHRRQFLYTLTSAASAACFGQMAVASPAAAFLDNPEVSRFITTMQNTHGFAAADLQKFFNRITPNDRALQLVGTPARPARKTYWRDYRKTRLTPQTILLGQQFLLRHAAALAKAEAQFHIPPAVITAILGIETRYGQYLGNYPVAEVIATHAFYHPARNAEFAAELTEFLLYVREHSIDPLSLHGSYAGAFGIPQFLPSSARRYAVDFDGKGAADLFQVEDAIGSVGRFLQQKGGWQAGRGISYTAAASTAALAQLTQKTTDHQYQPCFGYDEFAQLGGTTNAPADAGLFLLVDLENRYDNEYRLGTANFYAITRYNKSFKYAAAVEDLAAAIANT